ncbi:MAG TPA: DNA translocase FtsK, partial [Candidatus Paceibacterota bacterium]|nr:DNA translocase FtsK [Candidatus Paceibacterota bacterium]
PALFENHLAEDLEKILEETKNGETFDGYAGGEDPLYEEAKKIVIETRKASASFLQRRLRIGYARAARLLDILEEKGIIGPGEGAKPREVFLKQEAQNEEVDEGWEKI